MKWSWMKLEGTEYLALGSTRVTLHRGKYGPERGQYLLSGSVGSTIIGESYPTLGAARKAGEALNAFWAHRNESDAHICSRYDTASWVITMGESLRSAPGCAYLGSKMIFAAGEFGRAA